MTARGKRYRAGLERFDRARLYPLPEAFGLLAEMPGAKFDESVDVAVNLGVDPKHADQMVRGALGRLGKVLGPRGLMPNPKLGTVTMDVARAVSESKAGKVEYRVDKTGIIHASIGKRSFGAEKLLANASALLEAILRAKPAAAKGTYLKKLAVSTTMGPGIRIDPASVATAERTA
jgi:ribosomal protein L1